MTFRTHKRSFRMEKDEFARLVDLLDDDLVFGDPERLGRRQRLPALQLAVFLFQLGHVS